MILFVLLLSSLEMVVGQNSTCETAHPFCCGTQYAFPAGVNSGNGQSGPCYNCLVNVPNPSWYYLKIATMGDLILQIQTEPARDVDFVCWGPFNSVNSCNNLDCSKVIACDYGTTLIKNCTIPMAYTGQYFYFAFSNFSNLPCNILISQIGGTGSTDCAILPPPASNNSPVCINQTVQLSAQPVLSATYQWSGPNNFSSNAQNPSIPNAQLVNAGDYYLKVFINGVPYGDSAKTTVNLYQPSAFAGNDTMIQNGVYTTLHGSASNGSGSYSYHWEPHNLLVNPDVQNPQTVNLFSFTVFTLTITDLAAGCQATDYVNIDISGGPLAVSGVAVPSLVCAGTNSQLQAFGAGGTGNYTYHWTGPNGFSTYMQNPTVQPTVTTTYNVSINDGFNSANNTVTVNVLDLPIADAGPNQTIPYGTYTFLNGSVPGGSGNYFYTWTPASRLVNPNIQNPQTKNLTSTTLFSLVVTDLATNCVSDNSAHVSIDVTGGVLNTNPVATPSWICLGDTAQLHASAGGGNQGFYQYTWSSVPPGFTSTEEEPFVNPAENMTYKVSVFDGFNTVEDTVKVSIYPQPQIHLGPPDTTICIYDSLTLDAGNSGAAYLWSNGAVEQMIQIRAAGIVPESQFYNVKVTNDNGCYANSSITVNFSYGACTSVPYMTGLEDLVIYPNPSDGIFHLKNLDRAHISKISIFDMLGVEEPQTAILQGGSNGDDITIDLTRLTKGIYFIRISNTFGTTVRKVIIH